MTNAVKTEDTTCKREFQKEMTSKRQRSNDSLSLDPGPSGHGLNSAGVHPAEVSLSKLLNPTRQTGELFCS